MSAPVDLNEARKRRGKGAAASSKSGAAKADDPLSLRVKALNETHAFVLLGSDGWVLHEGVDWQQRPCVNFLSINGFRQWLDTERYLDGETQKTAGLGSLWLKHPLRRTFQGVAMAPEGVPEGWYNLWRGFAVTPAEPYDDLKHHVRHFRSLYDHVLRNVAKGNPDHARWIWAWFAQMVQDPVAKPGTAMVFRGEKGSGKSKMGEAIGSLWGIHHVVIDQPKHLVGSFNGHMANCVLLQAEEGFWAGDQTADGRLKSLITSQVQLIERKGVDATPMRNLVHLMVTSNSDWVVPATFDERRFAVFDVGNGNKQDHVFFKALDAELDAGGREHLLAYLLSFDLSAVDVRVIPHTTGLYEQKIATMSELQAWWIDRLREGKLIPQHGDWKREVGTDALFRCFRAYAELLRSKSRLLTKEQFGMALRKLMPDGFRANQKIWVDAYGDAGEELRNADGSRTRKRVNGYHIPSLRECREKFDQLVGAKVDWGDDVEAIPADSHAQADAYVAENAHSEGQRDSRGDFILTD